MNETRKEENEKMFDLLTSSNVVGRLSGTHTTMDGIANRRSWQEMQKQLRIIGRLCLASGTSGIICSQSLF